MIQFKQLGWIVHVVLSLVLLSAISQSHAMSVRERYLQNNPEVKVEQSSQKDSVPHKKNNVSKKHVVKTPAKHIAAKHEQHHAVQVPAKNHSVNAVKKSTSTKNTRMHHVKQRPAPVMIPKLAPTKFDRQQARAADQALKNPSVRKKAPAKSTQTKHVVKKRASQHTAKLVRNTHHKKSTH